MPVLAARASTGSTMRNGALEMAVGVEEAKVTADWPVSVLPAVCEPEAKPMFHPMTEVPSTAFEVP